MILKVTANIKRSYKFRQLQQQFYKISKKTRYFKKLLEIRTSFEKSLGNCKTSLKNKVNP